MSPDAKKAFLGKGWAFPVEIRAGQVATAAYEEDIRQAIRIIIGTNPGERVMRPDFGAGLDQFAFEPVNTTTMETLKRRVRDSLVDWEPRIDVDTVKVSTDPAERNLLLIEVAYRVRATNSLANLVYPFYLEEGTAR
jgi:uncharacterized protein